MNKYFAFILVLTAITFIGCDDSDDNSNPNDIDADGIEDTLDNCPQNFNPNQADNDNDGIGNDCDSTPNGEGGLPVGSTIVVGANITQDTTWDSDFIYQINGRVSVESGVTLTIEAGTLIKASAGQGTNASALVVARGATLNANGTAAAPIIMTSTADNIVRGQIVSPNLTANDRGLWGGLIILGAAPISVADNSGTAQIEGIPATDPNGNYGGTNATDSSGSITYISVRHGGTNIGDGNEINGITLGGVGSGTTFNHIEVVANVDDGIEFFGGTVNASNLVVWAQGDDAIDVDQAYSGTISNVVVVQGGISDHALEIDGPEGTAAGAYTLTNATLYGVSDSAEDGEVADYRAGATGANNNILVTGFTGIGEGLQLSDVELDNDGVASNYTAGTLTFDSWEVVLPSGVTTSAQIFDDRSEVGSTFEADAATFSSAVTTPTVGADTSVFAWTLTKAQAGKF